MFDFAKRWFHACRLTAEGRYERALPQLGRYSSAVLGLELSLEEWRLRFSLGFALLLDAAEVLSNRGSLARHNMQITLAFSLSTDIARPSLVGGPRDEPLGIAWHWTS